MSRAILLFTIAAAMLQMATAQDGATLYKQMCATCHEGGADRAPTREALRTMSAERVLAALETGAMISVTSRRTARSAGNRHIRQRQGFQRNSRDQAIRGSNVQGRRAGRYFRGYLERVGARNLQHSPAIQPGFTAAEVPRLRLKWAFAFRAISSPTHKPRFAAIAFSWVVPAA